jgi:hypothetical protein
MPLHSYLWDKSGDKTDVIQLLVGRKDMDVWMWGSELMAKRISRFPRTVFTYWTGTVQRVCTEIRLTIFIILSYIFSPTPSIQQLALCFIMPSSYTDTKYFDTIHSVSFSFSLPTSSTPIKQPHYCKHVLFIYIIYIYIYIYMMTLFAHMFII